MAEFDRAFAQVNGLPAPKPCCPLPLVPSVTFRPTVPVLPTPVQKQILKRR